MLQLRGGADGRDHPCRAGRASRSRAASPVWSNLLGALQGERRSACRRDAAGAAGEHVPPRPQGEARPGLRERTRCCAAVEAALRAHFSFDARELGQPVQQSDVIADGPGGCRASWRSTSRSSMAAREPAAQTVPFAAGAAAGVAHARRGRRGAAGRTADARSRAVRRCWRRWHEHAHRRAPLRAAAGRLSPARRRAGRAAARAARAPSPQEFAALEENVEQLYDDQFIETCADWVGALYRRPDRLSAAARRRAQGRLAARRGRQHHRLPPPQGHGADAGAAGAATSPTGRRTRWSSSSSSPPRST